MPSMVRAWVSSSTNRESISTTTGNFANRSRKTWKCCWASTVVGARSATCLPLIAALNAARRASSVLPNPTSPHRRRSIGRSDSMSALISASAATWSGVSSKGKEASSSCCQAVSGPKAIPGRASRNAYTLSSSSATSWTTLRARPIACAQAMKRRLALATEIFLDAVKVLDRNKELVALGVFQLEILALRAFRFDEAHPFEASDAVIDVNDKFIGSEIESELLGEIRGSGAAATRSTRRPAQPAEELSIGGKV